jgi:hypothetical protein
VDVDAEVTGVRARASRFGRDRQTLHRRRAPLTE